MVQANGEPTRRGLVQCGSQLSRQVNQVQFKLQFKTFKISSVKVFTVRGVKKAFIACVKLRGSRQVSRENEK